MPQRPLTSETLAALVQARVDAYGRGGQARLAREAGVCEATVFKLRHGGGCRPETADRVWAVLELKVSWRDKSTGREPDRP